MHIRKATILDATSIAEIYNEAIINTTATFDTEIKSVENRQEWLMQHSNKYPVLVAEFENTIVGFASMTRWSDRTAYDDTAEVSVYILPKWQAKGTGKKLFKAIIEAGKVGGLHTVLSRITQGNEKSIYIHKLNGFEEVGIMKEVGKKFAQLLDVTLMQLVYPFPAKQKNSD